MKTKRVVHDNDAKLLAVVERIRRDALFGGVCCALSAAMYLDDGTGPQYTEAVGSVGADELLAYAKRTRDMELPRIRRAVRWIKRQGR